MMIVYGFLNQENCCENDCKSCQQHRAIRIMKSKYEKQIQENSMTEIVNDTNREATEDMHTRTRALLGETALEKLSAARVAVFGLGGVGGPLAEALVRAGIGNIDLIDKDTVDITNLNRQILATGDNIGKSKASIAKERFFSINPTCNIRVYQTFFLPETKDEFDFSAYDYVADAIDTVAGKLSLIECCREKGVPIISSMGAGNHLDPASFRVADLYETSVCPLAKVMRRECKKRGIDHLKVVYSTEMPVQTGNRTPASVSFVPPVAGYIMAGEIIRDLIR